MDASYQSLEALPIEHLQIVFVASSSCSDDDAPACQQRPPSENSPPNGFTKPASPQAPELKGKSKKSPSKRVTGKERGRTRGAGPEKQAGEAEEVLDAPPEGFPLRRVISIEEDHLAHLLHGGPQPLLHQLSEEDGEEQNARDAPSDLGTSVASAAATPPSSHLPVQVSPRTKKSHFNLTSRGKETQQVRPAAARRKSAALMLKTRPAFCAIVSLQRAKEELLFAPDRLFKVVLVGNSSVGKTSLLRSFCEGRFHPTTTATVGENSGVGPVRWL